MCVNTGKCLACGKEAKKFKGGVKYQKYCGEECRAGVHSTECKICGKQFRAATRETTVCSSKCASKLRWKGKKLKKDRVCIGCGKEFVAKFTGGKNPAKGLYCSRECAWKSKAKKGKEKREEACRIRSIADGIVACLTSWMRCDICDCIYWHCGDSRPRTCSLVCCNLTKSGRYHRCGGCDIEIDRLVTPGKRLCAECLRASAAHQRRNSKAIRRARKKNNGPHEMIRAMDVFNRDEWICGLCGMPVSRCDVVPSPNAPTIDHVVPLSKGGTHTMSNVQCAHFECNWRKSDR